MWSGEQDCQRLLAQEWRQTWLGADIDPTVTSSPVLTGPLEAHHDSGGRPEKGHVGTAVHSNYEYMIYYDMVSK